MPWFMCRLQLRICVHFCKRESAILNQHVKELSSDSMLLLHAGGDYIIFIFMISTYTKKWRPVPATRPARSTIRPSQSGAGGEVYIGGGGVGVHREVRCVGRNLCEPSFWKAEEIKSQRERRFHHTRNNAAGGTRSCGVCNASGRPLEEIK